MKKAAKKKRPHKYATALLIGTAVVLFWRGMWGLLDHVIFPNNPLLSYLFSLCVGLYILYRSHMLIKELE